MGLGKDRKKMRDVIRDLGRADAYEVYSGKVKSVDEAKATCVVTIDEDLDIPEVRLRAVVTDDTGLWVVPKVGSFVIIALIDGGVDYVLLRASEVDKVFIKIGSKTLQVSSEGFVFNGGENGGVPKSPEVAERLNLVEDKVNELIEAYNAHTHQVTTSSACTAGGAAATGSATATTSTVVGSLQNTAPEDIENEDVQH